MDKNAKSLYEIVKLLNKCQLFLKIISDHVCDSSSLPH